VSHFATYIFIIFFFNEAELGERFDPDMALTPVQGILSVPGIAGCK